MLRNVLCASGSVTLASGALQIGLLLLLLLLNVLNTKYVWSTCQGHSWSDRTYFGPISQTACSSSSLFQRFWMATWPLTVTFCTSLDVCYFESNCTVSWIVMLCTQVQRIVVVFHLHCWRLETAGRRTSSLQLSISPAKRRLLSRLPLIFTPMHLSSAADVLKHLPNRSWRILAISDSPVLLLSVWRTS